jgi:hypothetical protein
MHKYTLKSHFMMYFLSDFPASGVSDFRITFARMTPAEINTKWQQLRERIARDFDNEEPDMKVVLFLIGVQELGKGPQKFSKRQKEELMHIATCRLFSELGFYELEGVDQDGWPHWKLVKTIPNYTLPEQELLMKSLVITYFDEQGQ